MSESFYVLIKIAIWGEYTILRYPFQHHNYHRLARRFCSTSKPTQPRYVIINLHMYSKSGLETRTDLLGTSMYYVCVQTVKHKQTLKQHEATNLNNNLNTNHHKSSYLIIFVHLNHELPKKKFLRPEAFNLFQVKAALAQNRLGDVPSMATVEMNAQTAFSCCMSVRFARNDISNAFCHVNLKALNNPRIGWKILNRFLSNGSAVYHGD